MQLSLEELAGCLDTHPDIVLRWIRQGRIPVKRRHDTCVFNPEVLKKWAAVHHVSFTLPEKKTQPLLEEKPAGLARAVEKGGIYYDIPGETVSEVLRSAVERMENVAGRRLKDLLLDKLLDRENMMSTGIGSGVAVPHPRSPVRNETDGEPEEQMAVCFLASPVDWQAVDNKPVFVLFIIVAPTAREHLHLLSRISYCMRDNAFRDLIADRPDPADLFAAISGYDSRLDGGTA